MKTKSLFITSVAVYILFFGASAVAGKTIYVDADAAGANNGSSWLNAYKYLQDALAAASTGDQILVAQGIYKPDKGQGITPGDRSASFHLTNGLIVKGGYAGFGTPNPDARDIDTYKTVLSGDLAGNDIEVADPAELISEPTRSENSCNVVNASDCDRTTLLEGLTITAGNANFVIWSGGGIINGKPTVSQCKITANSAIHSGGGIYFDHSAHTPGALLKDSIISHNSANSGGGVYNCAEIVNCTFTGNAAVDGPAGALDFVSDCETTVTDCIFNRNYAAGSAGAVYLGYSGTEVTFTRCLFIANSTDDKGGAIYSDGCTCGSYPTFYQCKFIANSAAGNGGAICNYGFSDAQLLSCLLVGNSSGGNGGAVCDEYDAGSSLINCTVTNNTAAGQGGAVCYDNYAYEIRRLANTIIWANSDKNGQTHQYSQIYLIEVSELQDVTNCCIQVIPPEIKGQGNITSNPLFVDIDGPDNIPGNEDDNLHLLEDSGCIDTGHNEYVPPQSSDLDGRPRIINGTVDRGAYEYAREQPGIIYVDDSATGANNGSSWANAYNYLQDAISVASSGEEIWVAQGTYLPSDGSGRYKTFKLKDGVAIYGGFSGKEGSLSARDWNLFPTVLSGDIGIPFDNSDNCYHVVVGSNNARLDGFTISGGRGATDSLGNYRRGAGMFNDGVSPLVANCIFRDNQAENGGGGMHNDWEASPTVINCVFLNNSANHDGGGMANNIRSCPLVQNCLFVSNNGGSEGGAVWNNQWSDPVFVNCTFAYNSASFTGGIHNNYHDEPTFKNCIFWENSGYEIYHDGDNMGIGWCDIQGGLTGIGGSGAFQDLGGNINQNPCFVDAAVGNYRLLVDSPCIDAGNNAAIPPSITTDLDGKPRIINGTVDMGAYEYEPQPSRIIYVDDSATGANNGSSWKDAFKYLQVGILTASSGDEIRVAQGIYKPNEGIIGGVPDERALTFQLKNGVTIKGGYAGFGQPDPDNRNIEVHKTILSGDIRGNDVDVSDPCLLPREPSRLDNIYHVVTGSGTDETAVLYGFTITGGHAVESGGGGMCNINGSPTVKSCTFLKNSAYALESHSMGGAIYNEYGNPTLVECKFVMNAVDVGIHDHGSGNGGAIADTHSSPKIINCTFIRNVAMGNDGGAVYHSGGSAELTNCTFESNTARIYGGGVCNWSGDSKVTGCTFVRNSSVGGGGLYNSYNTSSITGCTFTENVGSGFGGGVHNDSGGTFSGCTFSSNFSGVRGGGMYIYAGNLIMTGCTFVRNISGDGGGGMYIESNGSPLISNCVFSENSIYDGSGGGLQNIGSLTLINCQFTNNSAPWSIGGGMSNEGDSTLTNCIFAENSSGYGAGIHSMSGTATLINCLLKKNSAATWGGGLCSVSSAVSLINCTFGSNLSPLGSGLACRSPTNVPDSNVTITNSILWDQNGEIWIDDDSTVAISYSDIQGGWSGAGNIDTNPLFINPAGGNYHLRLKSPCINTGNNSAVPPSITTDLDGKPRIINGTVDMGAYEYVFQPSRIIYVDAGAGGENNGSSWTDAYNFLQDALADANDSETPTEIRVAAGTYRPDQGVGQTLCDRTATFQLLNGVAIKGGYAGFGTPRPDARDIEVYETILSGDLAGNDVDVNDPEKLGWEPTRSENSYRVVTGSQTNETAIIDGFTITAGNANYYDFSQCNGAGMFNDHGSPTVLNCTFIANFAGNDDGGGLGGAMYNYNSTPTLTNCRFIYNAAIALDGGEGAGGAMGNWDSSTTLTNCKFIGNISGRDGGAMWNYESNPDLFNCIFSGNLAREGGSGSFGGGMWIYNGSASLINCTFAGNTARSSQIGSGGGGIWAARGSVKLINCTFNGNAAQRGGAVSGDYQIIFLLSNCILWNDKPQEIYTLTPPVVTYSDVQGGWPGQSNLNANPLFVDPNAGNLRLLPNSPCIDAGNNAAILPYVTTDLDGKPRIVGGTVDMGAYEFYMLCVDDDAPADPGPGDQQISDPLEIGSEAHPFDSIQEALDRAKNGYAVVVQPGHYLSSDQWIYDDIKFNGKNITLTSTDPADAEIVDNTILRGTVLFNGTEEPNCTLAGFKIQNPYYGAVYGEHTHATLDRCVISGNGPCGATVLKDWDGMVSNCLITDNITLLLCGVYPAVSGFNGHFKNCTIANNISGISVGNATIENCIIYSNSGAQIGVSNGKTLHIRYSNVQGGLEGIVGGGSIDWGIGNIDTDPCFVRLGYWVQKPLKLIEGDYHLKSQGWSWNKDSESWTYDDVTSRCIDAGNPGEPLGDEPLTVPRDPENIWGENIRINMGAYGGTKQASMAPTPFALGLPPPDIEIGHWAILADLNNDGTVDVADVAGQVQDWLNNKAGQPGDLNRNGVVDMVDFALLAEDWLSMTAWLE